MQRRDDEINEILRNIDRKEDVEDQAASDNLLDRLPVGDRRPVQRQEEPEEDGGEDDGEESRGRKIWNAVKRIYFGFETVFVVVISLAVCGFLSHFLLTGAFDFLGLDQDDMPMEFVVEEGMTIHEVSKMLEENQVISSPLIFRLYAKLKNIEDTCAVPSAPRRRGRRRLSSGRGSPSTRLRTCWTKTASVTGTNSSTPCKRRTLSLTLKPSSPKVPTAFTGWRDIFSRILTISRSERIPSRRPTVSWCGLTR